MTSTEVATLQGRVLFTTRPWMGLYVPEFTADADRAAFVLALKALRERPFGTAPG
ncbi:hypothetical protein ACFOLM_19700 [Deinococcus soli (ex Cha et al. 2016)]|uniref:hypothetical protein n=1 Tax=Deinococcus soli (ex Cha et al. 2016) TaxID=1309411 RepID=UPI003616D6B7